MWLCDDELRKKTRKQTEKDKQLVFISTSLTGGASPPYVNLVNAIHNYTWLPIIC